VPEVDVAPGECSDPGNPQPSFGLRWTRPPAIKHDAGVGTAQDGAERFQADSLEQWSRWLERNHARRDGVWLVTWKKASGRQTFGYEESVVEALRFGWVDSKGGKVDDERTMLWFAPRKASSAWSRSNKVRIEQLEREGRLKPAGRAAVEAAKANGAWSLLDDVEDLVVPEDLSAAFAANPGSREQWDGFPPSARRAILEWVAQAKRPDTRAKRVAETARRAALGERANQWRPPSER
jgi:uncharacterized protein YdeI (YjbR/CyaY-like superfamily)